MTTNSPDSPDNKPSEEEAEAKPDPEGEAVEIEDPSEIAQHLTTEQKKGFLDGLMKKAGIEPLK